jgi:hypothetical protein
MELFSSELLASILGSTAAETAATAATTTAAAAIPEVTTAGLAGLGGDIAAADLVATTVPEVAAAAIPEAAAVVPEVATAVVPEATGIMQASNIPGVLKGAGVASPESIAASDALAAKAPFGVDLSSLTNSQAIDPTLDAAARQAGMGAPGVDLSAVANSRALDPTLSGAASAEGLGQGVNLKELGIGNYFDQGWKSASDLFSNVGDTIGKGADWVEAHPKSAFGAAILGGKLIDAATRQKLPTPEKYTGPLSKYHLGANYQPAIATPTYYTPTYGAQGGIMSLAMGGPATTPQQGQMYPQSQQVQTQFATPSQMPTSAEVINAGYEPATNPYTGTMPLRMSDGGQTSNPLLNFYKENVNPRFKEAPHADVGVNEDTDADTRLQDPLTAAATRAKKIAFMTKATPFKPQSYNPQLQEAQQQAIQAAGGGIMGYSLGGYAAGGRQPRLLKGPGDGMSDNIPATIADRQPARLADGEFVVPADVVSHLGNGSTDAGAKKLHGMMDKVRVARTGKKKQGTQINPDKYMPS